MKKSILEFKNKHQGKDIWIIASGSSLDYVDPLFFENKITIGINQSYNRFKNCVYYLRKEFLWLDKAIDYIKNNCPDSKLVVSDFDCGNRTGNKTIKNEIETDLDYWFFNHNNNNESEFENDLIRLLDNSNKENDDMVLASNSTILSGIYFAYYIGAKNIILCGADCGTLDGKFNYTDYYKGLEDNEEEVKRSYKNWLRKIEQQTKFLRDEFKKRGVNIYSLNPFINIGLEGHIYQKV